MVEDLRGRDLLSKEALQGSEILLIGSEGYIGTAIKAALAGHSIYSPSMSTLDITRPSLIDEAIGSLGGDLVVMAVGFTNVSGIEENDALYQKAIEVNFLGIKNVAEACFREGKRMIYIGGSGYERAGSLDYPGPHLEGDPFADEVEEMELLGRYAETKRFGSRAVMEAFKGDPSRLAVLYFDYPCGVVEGVGIDYQRPYYLQTLLINYERGIPPFGGQGLTITLVEDIAKVVRLIAREKLFGVFNVAAKGRTTPYLLTEHMIRELEGDEVARQIKIGSILKYQATLRQKGRESVYPVSGGLDSRYTEERLAAVEPDFAFLDWKKAVGRLMEGPGGLREFWQFLHTPEGRMRYKLPSLEA